MIERVGGHNAKGPLALRGHFWWSLAPGWMAADQRKLIKIQKLQRFWPQIVTAQSFTLGWQLLLLISNQTFPNNLICSLQILPFLSSFKGIWIYYIFPTFRCNVSWTNDNSGQRQNMRNEYIWRVCLSLAECQHWYSDFIESDADKGQITVSSI